MRKKATWPCFLSPFRCLREYGHCSDGIHKRVGNLVQLHLLHRVSAVKSSLDSMNESYHAQSMSLERRSW